MHNAVNSIPIAVGSRSSSRAKIFARENHLPVWYGSYEELLANPELDAIYIALPNSLHKEWSIKAAQAGKHILCEKPLALNAQECTEMEGAAKVNGVRLMEAFMYRFQPFVIKLKEMVAEGVIGEIKEIKSNFAFDISDRKDDIRLNPDLDGGALNDIGCYTVNISRYLMGAMPTKVANFFQKENAAGVDLSGSAVLYFEDGRFASLY